MRALEAFGVGALILGAAAVYVIAAFTAPSPWLRITLRCLPVLPLAVWTLWFDRSRPLQRQRPVIRLVGRLGLLIAVMLFAIAFLGLALNWLDDPSRIV
jgi:hypothetical protein